MKRPDRVDCAAVPIGATVGARRAAAGLYFFRAWPFTLGMSMTVGGVSSVLSAATSAQSSGSTDQVQLTAAISMQKKSQDLVAEQTRELIASATGVGQNLDVKA